MTFPWLSVQHCIALGSLAKMEIISDPQPPRKGMALRSKEPERHTATEADNIVIIIIMCSFVCFFSKLEHKAHYAAKNKETKQSQN